MATAYLFYGYDLGAVTTTEWEEMEAHRFGKEQIEDCVEQFGWMLVEDGYGSHMVKYEDLPNVFAERILRTWYTEAEIESFGYAWSYLEKEKGLTVKRVGWDEGDRLVLTSTSLGEADEANHVADAQTAVPEEVDRLLREAYATLDLHPARKGADGPRWMVGVLH